MAEQQNCPLFSVAFSSESSHWSLKFPLKGELTVQQAVEQSNLLKLPVIAELTASSSKPIVISVWGRVLDGKRLPNPSQCLVSANDRIEISLPALLTPQAWRKSRT